MEHFTQQSPELVSSPRAAVLVSDSRKYWHQENVTNSIMTQKIWWDIWSSFFYDNDVNFLTFIFSHNLITSLPENLDSIIKNFSGKVTLNIAGNSVPCDCYITSVKEKLVPASIVNATGIFFSDFSLEVNWLWIKILYVLLTFM